MVLASTSRVVQFHFAEMYHKIKEKLSLTFKKCTEKCEPKKVELFFMCLSSIYLTACTIFLVKNDEKKVS